jgi:probable O-glycosylation ligase (exosortase A-associated)
MGSFIEDNNSLALALVLTLPLMRFLHAMSQKAWLRWGLIGSMGLVLASVIGSQSRGGFLAAAAMVLFLVLKSRQRVAATLIGVVFAVLVVGFAPASWVSRMNTIGDYEEDSSAQGRLEAWGFAIDIASDRPLGGGFKVHENNGVYYSYVPDSRMVRAPHSIYFEVLGYHGFIGLALFLALFITTFRVAGSIPKMARGKPELFWAAELGAMIQVALIGYAVGGTFLNLAFYDLPYYLMAIAVCTRAVVTKSLAARDAVTTDQELRPPAPALATSEVYGPR